MYSGTTFRRDSGRIIGTHQKIDRIARKRLEKILGKDTGITFPRISEILYFEGKNGPDGIKLKSPSKDEYDHTLNPDDPTSHMFEIINDHMQNLANALSFDDRIRASFEAAWLAHAVVDGMTPAHHYSADDVQYEEQINRNAKINNLENRLLVEELTKRKGIVKKIDSWTSNSIVAHIVFELGVASVITTKKFKASGPSDRDIRRLKKEGFEAIFKESLKTIHNEKMYDLFCEKGWTRKLGSLTRQILLPEIIKTVTLAWYQAAILAERKQ